ncbi:MAG TPA: hypothetical protein VF598_08130, partial [Hymenobacter sp.]
MKQMTAEACQQLEKQNSAAAIAHYSATQAQAMLELAISTSISKHEKEVLAVAARGQSEEARNQFTAQLSTVLALQLIRSCATGTALYSRFQENAALGEAEDGFVRSFSDELCGQLSLLHTKGAFKGKSPAQRVEMFHQVFLQSLKTRGPEIMKLYGPAGNSAQTTSALSAKVVEQMKQQCSPS